MVLSTELQAKSHVSNREIFSVGRGLSTCVDVSPNFWPLVVVFFS